MVNDRILPAHVIRNFIWELLKLNMTITTINNKVPILYVKDEPEVAGANKIYALYGYVENANSGGNDVERRGSFALRVKSPTMAQLDEFLNIISTAFSSKDAAVEAVNIWSSQQPENYDGIRFTGFEVTYVEGGEPPDTEGGPVLGSINISYSYITRLELQYPAPVNSAGMWDDLRD